ncbi:4-alpha-glucanotransferase [Shumkonia mesophila]|uniref:4-alpha-glucanotransferase n=1 Tax=Shumkonia mesophila TaxID=2838854 RepID=UPI00293498F2|nr:4-alpha-glucanotransferase [Shumkonia mesophila]
MTDDPSHPASPPGPFLARLAEAVGIGPTYRDITGRVHSVAAGPLSALLAGLGRPAADEAAAEAVLRALEARWAERALDPVRVVVAGEGAVAVDALFAAAAGNVRLDWRLEFEDGGGRAGSAHPGELAGGRTEGPNDEPLLAVRLDLGAGLPLGYHRLCLDGPAVAGRKGCTQTLIVAPARCHLPAAWEAGGRAWGMAVEPYALRSAGDWGIGDFTALADLARAAGGLGAGAVGVTPLNALFPARPTHDSPYYGSNRGFLNALFIDVEAVPDWADDPAARQRFAGPAFARTRDALARLELIDYEGVASLKFDALRTLFAGFRVRHLEGGSERGAAFRDFARRGGGELAAHAAFDALSAALGPDWRSWPADCRRPDGAGVAAFCTTEPEAVDFFLYLQWEADRQLAAAAEAGRQAGLTIGLYRDIALGASPDGAEAWIHQDSLVFGAEIGAPPDAFNPDGQGWGLPPFDPHALGEAAYAPFIALLRANMRHAGAVRIDHVMGLARQFWIPAGGSPAEGAYMRFPLEDLLGIVALESRRHGCVVIGEDLGTVPDGFRERLAQAGILSYRLLYFERGDGGFTPPAHYPQLALAAVATHDLPPLPGYWSGHDIETRARLGLLASSGAERAAKRERVEDRTALADALHAHGGLPEGGHPSPDDIALSAYRFLARTPAHLLMVRPEDVLGLVEQTNLPGTRDEHPNWKRRLPLTVEALMADPRLRRLAAMLAAEGRAGPGMAPLAVDPGSQGDGDRQD